MKYGIKLSIIAAVGLLAAGCARTPTNPEDPYENFNRFMFALNMDVDHLVLRPTAKIYKNATPPFFQTGVNNAYNNLAELNTAPNDLFQGKINWTLIDITRFLVNSTIGIAGLFDPASHMGLPTHNNSLGLTLAYYSDNKKSPYLLLPILGPSTFRSLLSVPFAVATNPFTYYGPDYVTYGVYALGVINARANLLDTDKFVDDAFDPYAAVRNAYLTKTHDRVNRILTEGDYNRLKKPSEQENFSENLSSDTSYYTDFAPVSASGTACLKPESDGTCANAPAITPKPATASTALTKPQQPVSAAAPNNQPVAATQPQTNTQQPMVAAQNNPQNAAIPERIPAN